MNLKWPTIKLSICNMNGKHYQFMGQSTCLGLHLNSRKIVNGLHPSMFVRYYFKSHQQNQTLVIKPHINETNIKIAKKSSEHLTSLS